MIKEYIKIAGKWRFASIAKEKGKLKLTHVLVGGLPRAIDHGDILLGMAGSRQTTSKPAGTEPRKALEVYRDETPRLPFTGSACALWKAFERVGRDDNHRRRKQLPGECEGPQEPRHIQSLPGEAELLHVSH
jgi:hypothetical protein